MARKALDNELLTAAQEYASLGWRVLPLADRDKKPRLAEWHESVQNMSRLYRP